MRRLLILLSVVVGVTWGQGAPPTVTQIILTNAATVPQIVTVNNQGQTVHSITAVLSNAPAQTCSGLLRTLSLVLEGGNDGVAYFPILSIVQAGITGDSLTVTRNAVGGPFSFLRVNMQTFNTTNCRLSVGYTGAFGGSGSGVFNPNLSGMQITQATLLGGTGPGNVLLVPAPPVVQSGIALYGFTFTNYGTSTEVITVGGNAGVCTSAPTLVITTPVPAGNVTPSTIQYAPAGLPYLFMPQTANALCVAWTGTASSHYFYVYALWRYE